MERPANLIYGVDDRPPAAVCFLSAVQLLTVVAPILIFPVLVLRATHASEDIVVQVVAVSFFSLGIAAFLQALTARWIGSGYLIATCVASSYMPVSIEAINLGGMPMLTGMTLLAGCFEIGFAQLVLRLRAFFPAEISGLCILVIGIYTGVLGLRTVFSLDAAGAQATASVEDVAMSAATLAMMVGLNLWGRGALRMFCAIIGVAIGYILAVMFGLMSPHGLQVLQASPLFALPNWTPRIPSWDAGLIFPFMAAAMTNALRAMGDISTAQKINDRGWVRPEMRSIRNGIVANGVATMVSALAGGLGGNTQSSSIGMSNAAGVTSRRVAYWLGGLLLVLSACPLASAILVVAPPPVIGASLLFTSCFIVVSGLQVITTRLLDPRRTFTIGFALTLSLSRDYFPNLYDKAPAWMHPFTSSGLALGLLSALLLNAVFRIGVGSRAALSIVPDATPYDAVRGFLEQQGARWAARRDVVERAIFGTAQATESIIEHCEVGEPIQIEATFDEYNLDVRISYRGEMLPLEDRRPTDEVIRETEDGVRRLAGFLLRQNADRVRSSSKSGWSILEFHFVH